MSKCPKCPTGRMSGPTYATDSLRGERLHYRCSTCGYEESRPCADSKRSPDIDIIRALRGGS